ncbi:hypothetical protein OF83DRAFT_673314 [Amylostereum chailletii]|nr:hypothetical protein OF83DRAFT_673314 [Amylostereum chailletii]
MNHGPTGASARRSTLRVKRHSLRLIQLNIEHLQMHRFPPSRLGDRLGVRSICTSIEGFLPGTSDAFRPGSLLRLHGAASSNGSCGTKRVFSPRGGGQLTHERNDLCLVLVPQKIKNRYTARIRPFNVNSGRDGHARTCYRFQASNGAEREGSLNFHRLRLSPSPIPSVSVSDPAVTFRDFHEEGARHPGGQRWSATETNGVMLTRRIMYTDLRVCGEHVAIRIRLLGDGWLILHHLNAL